MIKQILFIFCLMLSRIAVAQVHYPAAVHFIPLALENKNLKMAYMDIPSPQANGQSIVLLHGKNFSGVYWKDLIPFLTSAGYRVIVPDQPGWGLSDKEDLHYSFSMLARTTAILLDSLHIGKVTLLGHSMGGMLAIRFSLQYPERVTKMILEDPIGLEDYRLFVPYTAIEKLFDKERKATYESYKKYQRGYYPAWKPEYEQYVKVQADALNSSSFEKIAWVNALTTDMIYQQPVIYELGAIQAPVLLVTGELDRTIVGKDLLADSVKNRHGDYPKLGRWAQQQMKNAQWIQLPGVGHIPHIQDLALFERTIQEFIKN